MLSGYIHILMYVLLFNHSLGRDFNLIAKTVFAWKEAVASSVNPTRVQQSPTKDSVKEKDTMRSQKSILMTNAVLKLYVVSPLW